MSNYIKVISVNALGKITSSVLPQLPVTNQKVFRDKIQLSPEQIEFSKNTAKKVAEFKKLKAERDRFKKEIDRNTLMNVDKLFNNVIKNSEL